MHCIYRLIWSKSLGVIAEPARMQEIIGNLIIFVFFIETKCEFLPITCFNAT
jgi:hypothetical protein